jgi:hypothetical protein
MSNSFNEKLEEIAQGIANEYSAGHYYGGAKPLIIQEALKAIRDLVLSEIIGKDKKSKTTAPKPLIRHIGDGDESFVVSGGSVRTFDVVTDSQNELRAEQRNKILKGDK